MDPENGTDAPSDLLSTIEQKLHEHGYQFVEGADHDGNRWVSFVGIEIATVPEGEEEKLVARVKKWLEEQGREY